MTYNKAKNNIYKQILILWSSLLDLVEWADVIQRMDDPQITLRYIWMCIIFFLFFFLTLPYSDIPVSLLKDKVIFQIIQTGLALDRFIHCQCISHDRELSSTLIPLNSNSGETKVFLSHLEFLCSWPPNRTKTILTSYWNISIQSVTFVASKWQEGIKHD